MEPSFLTRVVLAFVAFFKLLVDARFAGQVQALREGRLPPGLEPPPAPWLVEAPKVPAALPAPGVTDHSPALQLLAILQREGRLVDFLQEDISSFGDADVGAAARIVHDGCLQALSEYLVLEPLRTEGEGASVTIPKGFDASAIRLTGNVTGEPPFTGSLRHHGWRVREVRMPRPPPGTDARVIAPAEVEL